MERHPFDFVSFVMGVVILTIGIAFLFGAHGASWLIPLAIIGVGATLFAAALQRALRKPHDAPAH